MSIKCSCVYYQDFKYHEYDQDSWEYEPFCNHPKGQFFLNEEDDLKSCPGKLILNKKDNLLRIMEKFFYGKPEVFKPTFDSVGVVKLAEYTALYLWLNQTPEDNDTHELRHQLKHLHENGIFDFKD
jgi:hypothetical protein